MATVKFGTVIAILTAIKATLISTLQFVQSAKWIKISILDEVRIVDDYGDFAVSAQNKRNVFECIEKGLLTRKSSSGMWARYTLSKEAIGLLNELPPTNK